MAEPDRIADHLKYSFWTFYTPFHPYVRDFAIKIKLVEHAGRQNFLLGTIAPHLSIKEFIQSLVDKGFGNHFIAWNDDGEIASLRRVDNFEYQYHIRIFEDREVRAHYEFTPECYPIAHLNEENMLPRREEFLEILGDTIVPSQSSL